MSDTAWHIEDFVIREQQAAVAIELIKASGNQLLQLNMGEGKPLVQRLARAASHQQRLKRQEVVHLIDCFYPVVKMLFILN